MLNMFDYIELVSWATVLLGIFLIWLELLIPGFGLPGISGIIIFGIGMHLAINLAAISLANLFLVIGIFLLFLILLLIYLKKTEKISSLVLKTSLDAKRGYNSSKGMEKYLGLKAVARTDLRPSGYIEIQDRILDAISMEGYVEKGQELEVKKVEAGKIFVRRV